MKSIIRNISFWLEFHIGCFVTNSRKFRQFEKYIKSKYPEKFKK
jgi:hypothetical protein